MTSKRFSLVFVLAVCLTASCGDSADELGDPVDGGVQGDVVISNGRDGGPDDAPDNGIIPPPGAGEGERCRSTSPACADGLTCLNLSPIEAEDPVVVCLAQCRINADCSGSTLDPPAETCDPSFGVCVQELVPEGGVADLFRETDDQILKGCEFGAQPYVGAQFGLALDSEFSCVRPCASNDDCSTRGIETCNVNRGLLNSQFTGLCARGPGLAGAACSSRDATRSCTLDFDNRGLVFCLDSFRQSFNQGPGAGICTAFCGDIDNDDATPLEACRPQREGEAAPRCQTGNFNNPDFGVCSDDCSAFPNSCSGGATACFPFPGFEVPELARCLEVETATTSPLPVYDPSRLLRTTPMPPTPEDDCSGRENECPRDSFCVILDQDITTGDPTLGGCMYGCSPDAAPAESGCSGRAVGGSRTSQCIRLGEEDTFGFCGSP